MKIRVNGEEIKLTLKKEKLNLSDTLKLLGYKNNTIVVELNNLIINSDGWQSEFIKDGDKLEIVSIVGGG